MEMDAGVTDEREMSMGSGWWDGVGGGAVQWLRVKAWMLIEMR